MNLLLCDACKRTVPNPGRLPAGWLHRYVYDKPHDRSRRARDQDGRWHHLCPDCVPAAVERHRATRGRLS